MITKDMKIIEVLQVNPQTAYVFSSYGMGCIHCLLTAKQSKKQQQLTA